MADWMDWNRRMSLVAWLGAMVSPGIAQEAPAVPLPPRGVVIDDTDLCLDLSVWWSRNEERFLMTGPRSQQPGGGMVASRIATNLRQALDSDSPDLIGASLMALASIGHEVPGARLTDDFARHLHHHDQEVRETAALALGVAGIDAERDRDLLVQLVRGDAELGAAAGAAPALRTRVFATYGLGLLASRSDRFATKRAVFQVMQWLLAQEHRGDDLPVAAVHALANLQLQAGGEAAADLQTRGLELLTDTWARRSVQPGDLVACACPPAIGKLLGRAHPRRGDLVTRFVQELGRNLPTELGRPSVTQSCAIALGLLAQPNDATAVDALAVAAAEHPDLSARMFACLALGEISGRRARGILLMMLAQPAGPHPVYAREWAAVALGVAVQLDPPDADERAAIARAFRTAVVARVPVRPHLLIAAGLAGADDAVADLWQRSNGTSDEACAAAYCQALQLLGHREALPALRELFASSQRRFLVRAAAARALRSLGEEGLAAELIRAALASPNLATQYCNLLTAGELAVETDVDALLQALADARRASLSRAFAAMALGTAARRTAASWSHSLGMHTNLLAAPATLCNHRSGVLDLQ
jgi:HEAT repeat protein